MPSVQPLGAHRAPPRERELGVHGGSDTDAPVGQQSTTPVSRDKPVRARRRVPLSGFDCSHPKRSRHLPSSGRGYAPGCPKYESHDDSGKRFDNGSIRSQNAREPAVANGFVSRQSQQRHSSSNARRASAACAPRRRSLSPHTQPRLRECIGDIPCLASRPRHRRGARVCGRLPGSAEVADADPATALRPEGRAARRYGAAQTVRRRLPFRAVRRSVSWLFSCKND